MQPDDSNHRPTLPLQSPIAPDATRTFSDPSSTLAFVPAFAPIPVDAWPTGLTRYQPLHQIGDGGMGEVYLAHDTQLDRQVAIKFARLDRGRVTDTADRILAEARAAARLHHAGICPVYDADVCDGVPYLTMAFVQGPTLAAELKRLGPCPPQYAARIVRGVAEAMQYAHDNGVIHRDLKPANILLTADHEPVVTDFGLAVRLDRDGLAHGVISGTPHYMAPEQAAGDAEKIGERTDVFALGVILFEMLTGRTPFDGTAREVLEQVKTKPVPPVRKLRKDVPPALARIVAKATARDPADRFDGMTAFADVLAHYLRAEQAPKKKTPGWVFALLAGLIAVFVLPLLLCGLGLLLPAITKMQTIPPPTPLSDQPADGDERVERLLQQGIAFANAGQHDDAEKKFAEALAIDPQATGPRLFRGWSRQETKRFEDALGDFDALVKREPKNEFYRRNRAEVLIHLKRYRDAIADLDFADRFKSDVTETFALRGEAWYELMEYDKAHSDLNRALALDPKNANALFLKALTKKALGDHLGADTDVTRVKEQERFLKERFRERLNTAFPPAPPTPQPPPAPGK